jgi:ATP-dependent Clp protease protease subunit
MTIYDTMQYISSPIKTICIGEAYSSAAVILTAGTKGRRWAYPSSRMMIHNIWTEEMSGTQKEIEEKSKQIKIVNDAMIKIISKHTGQTIRRVKKDCEKDKYFTCEEAMKYGLVDHIIVSSKSDNNPA